MRNQFLVLSSSILLIALALTACSANASETATPVNARPTLAATHPASTVATTPFATDTSVPAATSTSTAGTSSVSFARDVMPIFENTCIKCHGGESMKEGLDLKTYAALMAGSRNGSVVTPGNANDSYLVDQLLNKGKNAQAWPETRPCSNSAHR